MSSVRPALARACPAAAIVRAVLAAVLAAWGAACPAQGDAPSTERLRFGGFGTLGLVHAAAPDGWSFRRDINQVGSSRSTRADVDSRLGLQLNYQATAQIEVVGQLLVARTSPYENFFDGVQRAFAAYRPSADWVVRAGRVNLDQYMMSDYRNVGFAYLPVRPPVDFYGFPANALDGVDVTRSWHVGETLWRLKGYVGQAHSGDLSSSGSRLLVNSLYGFVVSREAGGLLMRASVSSVDVGHLTEGGQAFDRVLAALTTLPSASVVDDVGMLRRRLDYTGKAATYATVALNDDWNTWQFTAEAGRVFGPPLTRFEDAYVRVARRFGPVAAFGGFSRVLGTYSRVQTPNWLPALVPAIGDAAASEAQYAAELAVNAINSAAANQHTLSLGARWDLHPQLALKLQWDRIETDRDGGRLWVGAANRPGRSHVTTATLDFVF